MKSYKEISNYIDSRKELDKQVIYIENNETAFGVLFVDELRVPYLFIYNNDALTIFLSNPMIDPVTLTTLLNNLYSANHLDFIKREIFEIVFDYGLQDAKTSVDVYRIGNGIYYSASIRCGTIPYPEFYDTTKVALNYRNFYNVDIKRCMRKAVFKKEDLPYSGMIKMFDSFLRYRAGQ